MTTVFPEQAWSVLDTAINQVFDKNASDLSYEELYRSAYEMVLNRHGETLYNSIEKTLTERVSVIVKPIVSSPDETFLKDVTSIWGEYKQATQMVRDLMMYLDRNYVVSKKLLPIYDNGVQVFKTVVFKDSKQGIRVQNLILAEIKKDRAGESVDKMLLRSVVRMLHDTRAYEDFLEEELLKVTRLHYKSYGEEISSQSTVPQYLEKAHLKVQEENRRIDWYLIEQTRKKFEEILRDELVSKHMDFIIESTNEGFQTLIANDKYEDLKRMFELFSFHPKHLEVLREKFKAYCNKTALDYVSDVSKASKPIEYIQGLFDLKVKYDTVIEKSFKGNANFMKSLNDALESCVNGFQRFSEFLSKFLDYMIKNVKKFDKKVEEDLERGMVFFRMLADKNVFENNYKSEMSKRLLLPRDDFESSLAAERYFITKLKLEEGYAFTAKIEGMLNDMKLSSKTGEQYKKHKAYKSKPQDIDFNVNILTTNSWPSFQLSNPVLPKELKSCVDSFEKFYSDSYSGRKITWQSTIGVGNVKGIFALGEYDMSCSTYQIMVLTLVNEDPNLTFKKILDSTQVNEKDMKRNIQALYAGKYKVLVKSGDQKDIKDDDVFTVNKYFKSDKSSFTIQFGSSSSSTSKSDDTEQIPIIDAAIVKEMKLKKKLNITKLQTDVMMSLKSSKCDPKLIRKRIEELIKNDTISLDTEDKSIVIYK
eukprot:gene4140-7450_t